MRRPTVSVLSFLALMSWSCARGSNPQRDGGDGGSLIGNGGEDGGDGGSPTVDAGVDCGDPLASPDMECGTLSWTASNTASRLRNHHFTFIAGSDAGTFLYVLGGINYTTVFENADMAPILADGSLGAFSSTAPLQVAAGGLVGAVVGNVVVVAGGHTVTDVTDQSFTSKIQNDGTLAPWAPAGSIVHPRMHGGAFVFGEKVYVLGGFDGASKVWDDVVSASVQADGTLTAWTSAGTLPQPLSHFSVARVGNQVYLAGGLNKSAYVNPPALTNVYRGTIAADGTLGSWQDMTALPVAMATHAAFVYGGHLYVAGGVNINSKAPQQENRVWSAQLNSDGSLGSWAEASKLPIRRAHVHQLPMFENHFYSVAGAIDFDLHSTPEIDIGTFE